jgi:hypothetical protein
MVGRAFAARLFACACAIGDAASDSDQRDRRMSKNNSKKSELLTQVIPWLHDI